ncbi:GDSL esterase/lipase At3g48460-like [Cynara cardunculus var. scolymus]|uniref:GDSL esterase/lipase At3g48460-like n=1 Tax=Cynara cardunculus var. scolymus TaxID=59895 RepID=UPI000D62D416|nr:GDSL esterase/lipase At3g48460-like [Cynara cardunculus var. scolymus]
MNARFLSLPLLALVLFLIPSPTFAHRTPHNKPKPQPPPSDIPPIDPNPQTPPVDPNPQTPPVDPNQKPPPVDPNQKPPPVDPKPKTPPVDPNPKTPPVDPNPKTPPVDPNPKTPPVDPNPKTPPVDPNPKTPPVDPNPKTPPVDPNPKTPPVDPNPKTPPVDPNQNPPPPEDPKKKSPPPQDPKKKTPPPQDPNQKPPPTEPDQKPPPTEPNQKPPPTKPDQKPPPTEPNQKPPPTEPNQKPPPTNPNPNSPPEPPQKPCPFQDRYKGHFTAVYAFGDSYTDTGNAQYMGGLTLSFSGSLSSPYGSTTFGKTSNRLCDGRLVLDFVTDSLGLPTLPPYQSTSSNFTNGVNFAVAGSTSLAGDMISKIVRHFLWKGSLLGVWTQIDWFQKYQRSHICMGLDPKACANKLSTSLFWIGDIGITDYSRAAGSTLSLSNIAKSSVGYTIQILRTLIRAGAKNIVVQGLPPVGCLPIDASICPLRQLDKIGCSTIINGGIIIHNDILKHKLNLYRKLFPDTNIIYADYWNAYYAIVDNPQKYQFQEVHKTCCGAASGKSGNLNFNLQSLCGSSGTSVCNDPSKYINWDGIHTTEAMNLQVTDLLLNQGYCQPSFEQVVKKTTIVVTETTTKTTS